MTSTYVHLQDSYFAEMNKVGDLKAIGYQKPASKVFDYDITLAGDVATWTATSQEPLNDCASGTEWTVASEAAGSAQAGAKHTATAGCSELTPSFTSIGAGTL